MYFSLSIYIYTYSIYTSEYIHIQIYTYMHTYIYNDQHFSRTDAFAVAGATGLKSVDIHSLSPAFFNSTHSGTYIVIANIVLTIVIAMNYVYVFLPLMVILFVIMNIFAVTGMLNSVTDIYILILISCDVEYCFAMITSMMILRSNYKSQTRRPQAFAFEPRNLLHRIPNATYLSPEPLPWRNISAR